MKRFWKRFSTKYLQKHSTSAKQETTLEDATAKSFQNNKADSKQFDSQLKHALNYEQSTNASDNEHEDCTVWWEDKDIQHLCKKYQKDSKRQNEAGSLPNESESKLEKDFCKWKNTFENQNEIDSVSDYWLENDKEDCDSKIRLNQRSYEFFSQEYDEIEVRSQNSLDSEDKSLIEAGLMHLCTCDNVVTRLSQFTECKKCGGKQGSYSMAQLCNGGSDSDQDSYSDRASSIYSFYQESEDGQDIKSTFQSSDEFEERKKKMFQYVGTQTKLLNGSCDSDPDSNSDKASVVTNESDISSSIEDSKNEQGLDS